jgi:hypothetical protein
MYHRGGLARHPVCNGGNLPSQANQAGTASEAGARGVRRRITFDLDAIERALFDGDSPAYRLMEAVVSVKEHEGWEGY